MRNIIHSEPVPKTLRKKHKQRTSPQTHIDVGVMDQQVQSWQDLPNGLYRRWWVFVSTQIHYHPRYIPQEADGDLRLDKCEQRTDHTQTNYIVPKLGAIPNYVSCKITSSVTVIE